MLFLLASLYTNTAHAQDLQCRKVWTTDGENVIEGTACWWENSPHDVISWENMTEWERAQSIKWLEPEYRYNRTTISKGAALKICKDGAETTLTSCNTWVDRINATASPVLCGKLGTSWKAAACYYLTIEAASVTKEIYCKDTLYQEKLGRCREMENKTSGA